MKKTMALFLSLLLLLSVLSPATAFAAAVPAEESDAAFEPNEAAPDAGENAAAADEAEVPGDTAGEADTGEEEPLIEETEAQERADGESAPAEESAVQSEATPEAGARVYLAATAGGSVSWAEDRSGDARIGRVDPGSTFELTGGYGPPAGSRLVLTATPQTGYRFLGWYTEWNSTNPSLVASAATLTYTMPTDYGQTLTAAFGEESATITSVSVTVNSQPKASQNQTAVPDLSVSGTGVSLGGAYYASFCGYSTGSDEFVFVEGKIYYIRATLTAAEGYTFQKGAEANSIDPGFVFPGSCAVSGESAALRLVTVSQDAKSLIVWIAIQPESGSTPRIAAVTVNLTPPAVGSGASDALGCVSVPAGEHYSVVPAVACYEQEPVFGDWNEIITPAFTGNFEAGKTYYMAIGLIPDTGYGFMQGGGGYPNTTVTVNGAALFSGTDLWVTNMVDPAYGYRSYGELFVSFTPSEPSGDPVVAFITRAYNLILQRDPEPQGLSDWYNALKNGTVAGGTLVNGFILSPEFLSRGLPDEQVVEILYAVMLDRSPDANGKAEWVGYLNNGMSYTFIVSGFVGSAEFRGICAGYGIDPGSTPQLEYRDRNPKVTAFVSRNYRLILQRTPDAEGLNAWAGALLNGTQTGAAVVNGFVLSNEFVSRGLPSDKVVEILYNVMLDRVPDANGKAVWVDFLNEGHSYTDLVNGFAGSAEFQGICADAGITAGWA